MCFRVSSHFVHFHLLLVVATVDEIVELILAAETREPHSVASTTLLKGLACLPALAPCKLVCFHFESVLLDAAEYIKPPVVPHRRPCLNYVIWLRVQAGQVLHRTVQLLIKTVLFKVFSLLA